PVEKKVVAFIVRRGKPLAAADLGPEKEIAAAVAAWRATLGPRTSRKADGLAARLRERVWEPLLPHLKEGQTVLISPEGSLALLPCAALPGKKPGTYLVEDHAVAVVPVPQVLPEMLRGPAASGKPSMLLVGDVDFDFKPKGVSSTRAPGSWQHLPGTGKEVE